MKLRHIAIALLASAALAIPAFADTTPAFTDVSVDGVRIETEFPAYEADGTVMLPLRAAAEALGCSVGWDDDTWAITLTRGKDVIGFRVDTDKMTVGGEEKTMPKVTEMIGDLTYVPLRAMAEAFGCTVSYDEPNTVAGIYTGTDKHILTVGDYIFRVGQTVENAFAYNGQPTYTLGSTDGRQIHVYADYVSAVVVLFSDGGLIDGYYTCSLLFDAEGHKYGDAPTDTTKDVQVIETEDGVVTLYNDLIAGKLYAMSYKAGHKSMPYTTEEALGQQSLIGLQILNAFRYANEKAPLVWDADAAACSLTQARYNAARTVPTHTGIDGSTAISRYLIYQPSYKFRWWGENLCAAASDIFTAMNGFINSAPHRARLLESAARCGIGLAYDANGPYKYAGVMLLLDDAK